MTLNPQHPVRLSALDPNRPLPGEISPQMRRRWVAGVSAVVIFAVGFTVGLGVSPEPPQELVMENARLMSELKQLEREAVAMRRELAYRSPHVVDEEAKLSPSIKARHRAKAQEVGKALLREQAQGAADLFFWFVDRWNRVLDHPREDDRVERRSALLTQLLTGMAENLNPGDFVPWQTELMNANWLAELHFDLDGDGLPTTRFGRNVRDGFLEKSVCHIAMAFNQSVTDAHVLFTPQFRCDDPKNRISVFFHGGTLNDALDQFARTVRQHGSLVLDREESNHRLLLVADAR